MFDFSQMYNGQGGASAEEYAARLQAQMMANQTARMEREMAGAAAQQVQITPREEAWWICKRASCQGWQVRILNGQRIEWVREGKILAGSLSGNLQVSFIESCRYLARFLEGTQ